MSFENMVEHLKYENPLHTRIRMFPNQENIWF